MPTKDIDISPQIVQSIRRVLLRGETAQVKFNERDGVVKVFGVKMKLEKSEEPTENLSPLAKAVLCGDRILPEPY